ncbi:MAG TPA: hypothetical protein VGO50_17220 [Pyrinomonadaceae bacterium]|jgi:hypothetical protein|nr:hypothetical protein [Pyrinomonadaceae bacterium]
MNDVLKRLKAPAIGLLVTAILDLAIGALTILSGLARLAGVLGKEPRIRDDAEKLGYFIGTGLGYGGGILSVILAPIIIYGAVKMMKGQSRGLSMTAAVLSIIPITCCSFPLGMIFGIWALVVLRNPEVKAYFESGYNPSANPPNPPQNWQ